jgi:predicted RNA-binding Zn-ribbon protein involved in translation (DUF1610 family)
MSSIRIQTYAEKIVNKGGGTKSGSTWEPLTDEANPAEIKRTMMKVVGKDGKMTLQCWRKVRTEQKVTGSDYIIFNCPSCGKRNKHVSYNGKPEEGGNILVFRCNKCLIQVEVKRPMQLASPSENLVHLPGSLNYNKKG